MVHVNNYIHSTWENIFSYLWIPLSLVLLHPFNSLFSGQPG